MKIANVLLVLLMLVSASMQAQHKTLVVVFDALRPDYITAQHMPHLYEFKKENAYGAHHHSIFPTVTRVNSSSFGTGSYPGTHGILGNSIYVPAADSTKVFDTGDAQNLFFIAGRNKGQLLTTSTMGSLLEAAGKQMMVFSSGSSGQALLQNSNIAGAGIVNTSMILPQSLKVAVEKRIGAAPVGGKPAGARHQWVTDALLQFGLIKDGPDVCTIWFSDPDATAHAKGIGADTTFLAIQEVDRQFGRIVQHLKATGQFDSYNIMVSADHGFVTHIGKHSLKEVLIQNGLKQSVDSDDVIIADGAIYVKNQNKSLIQRIVATLQQLEWIGGIYTKGAKKGDELGWVPGTISFEAIHWDHPQRAASILVDRNWTDATNEFGFKGTSYNNGIAGHGSLSPYEVHIPLILAGPDFKQSFVSELPTSFIDIAPTVLKLHGITIPAAMNGRVLQEYFKNTINPNPFKKQTIKTEVALPTGKYILELQLSIYGEYKYVDFSKKTFLKL